MYTWNQFNSNRQLSVNYMFKMLLHFVLFVKKLLMGSSCFKRFFLINTYRIENEKPLKMWIKKPKPRLLFASISFWSEYFIRKFIYYYLMRFGLLIFFVFFLYSVDCDFVTSLYWIYY